MDITQAFAFTDERFGETGGGRDGTNSISHTERNHKRYQDQVYSQYCCQQLLQAVETSQNFSARDLSNLALIYQSSSEKHLAPIPVLSQQQVVTSPLSLFPPLPPIHTPSSCSEKDSTTLTNNKSLLLLKQNVWIDFSSYLGDKFHISPPLAHCYT